MLDDDFLRGLDEAFPSAYEGARTHVESDRETLLQLARDDETLARLLVRPYGAAVLWWPYVRGSFGKEVLAQEAVVRIVLLVDRLHGFSPTEEEAREQTQRVLRRAFDPVEIRSIFQRETADDGRLAWAAPVLVPLLGPLLSPATAWNLARKVPLAYMAWSAALVAATVATIPLVTGFSIASHAARDAENYPRDVPSTATTRAPSRPRPGPN